MFGGLRSYYTLLYFLLELLPVLARILRRRKVTLVVMSVLLAF
jgi:hypothetical protein